MQHRQLACIPFLLTEKGEGQKIQNCLQVKLVSFAKTYFYFAQFFLCGLLNVLCVALRETFKKTHSKKEVLKKIVDFQLCLVFVRSS